MTIAIPLARALAELHRHDLVHRDIKPSNIIFVTGAPKLADIGLVASTSDSRSFVGTEGFIPPEGPGTPQADLYSLGIVLYVMATGKHHRDFPEPPPDLATRPDRKPFLELTAVIHRACQANPRDRYQSAGSFLGDLERLESGQSVKRRHSFLRTWSWTWKIGVALSLFAVAIIAIWHHRAQQRALTEQGDRPPSFEQSGTTSFAAWEAFMRGGTLATAFTPAGLLNAGSRKSEPHFCPKLATCSP